MVTHDNVHSEILLHYEQKYLNSEQCAKIRMWDIKKQ